MEIEILRDRIRTFIEGRFPAARGLGEGEPLLRNNVLDSLGVLDVVAFLEREFGFTVADEDLAAENFESLGAMTEFARRKLEGSARGE